MSLRLAMLGTAVVVLLSPFAAPPTAVASSRGPSPAQIRTAVRHAERSREVWATVNICNTRHHPHALGIRGQLPGLGFPAGLYIRIQVDYWVGAKRKFVPDVHAKKAISLGTVSSGRHQAGFTWKFAPPAILSGTVTFEWRLGRKVIGRTNRLTATGIKHVDDGDPKGYSAATCRILK